MMSPKSWLLLLLAGGLLASCTPPTPAQPTAALENTPAAQETTVATAVPLPTAATLPSTDTPMPEPATVEPTFPAGLLAFMSTDEFGNALKLQLWSPGSEPQTVPVDSANPDTLASCYPAPRWSPDGRYLALNRNSEALGLVVVDVQQDNALTFIPDAIGSAAWAPDSTRLYHTRPLDWNTSTLTPENDQGLWVWDMATGQDTQAFAAFPNFPLGDIKLSPDGTRLSMHAVQYEGMGQFALADADGQHMQVVPAAVGNYAWSPDSEWLVFDEVTYIPQPPARLMRMDRNGENISVLYDPSDMVVFEPQWSPDGQTIAFFQMPGVENVALITSLWVIGADGANLREVRVPELTDVRWVEWTSDSAALVVGGREGLYLVPLTEGQPLRIAPGTCPVWQP